MKELWELQVGTLFIWENYPDEVHRVTAEKAANRDIYAECFMSRSGNIWKPITPRTQNWNPYCSVRVVRIDFVEV